MTAAPTAGIRTTQTSTGVTTVGGFSAVHVEKPPQPFFLGFPAGYNQSVPSVTPMTPNKLGVSVSLCGDEDSSQHRSSMQGGEMP